MASIGLVTVLAALFTADALLTDAALPESPKPPQTRPPAQTATPGPPRAPGQSSRGPDILETIVSQQFTFEDAQESSLIGMIINDGTPVHARVLVKGGDRSGLIAWTVSPKVKLYFISLKEALHVSFTPQVEELIDETQRRQGRPTRNLLTFFDSGISEERLVFIRVRNRLFEFHIAKDKEDEMFELIEKLSL